MKSIIISTIFFAILAISIYSSPCSLPFYYQFTDNFTLQSNNVEQALINNSSLAKFALDSFQTSNKVHIYNISGSIKTDSSRKSVSGQGLKVTIVEGFNINLSLMANVSKLVVQKDHFNISVTVDNCMTSYDKQIKEGQLNPIVQNIKTSCNFDNLKITYSPAPSSKEQKGLDDAMSGPTKSVKSQITQFYTQNVIKTLESAIKNLTSKQYITMIFKNGIYKYKNGNNIMDFNMNTQQLIYSSSDKTLKNGINGSGLGTIGSQQQQCFSDQSFSRIQNGHTFISRQFILNMIHQAWKIYPQFNDVSISKDTIKKASTLKFKLSDLSQAIPDALSKYPKYSENEIAFSCRVISLGQFNLDLSSTYQDLKWSCNGFLFDQNHNKIPLTYFDILIRHSVSIGITTRYFTVLVIDLQIKDLNFYQVDQMNVNSKAATSLISDVFSDMNVFTIGTYFDIPIGNNQIVFSKEGIWLKNNKNIFNINDIDNNNKVILQNNFEDSDRNLAKITGDKNIRIQLQ